MELSQVLAHPALTGMPRPDLQALIDRITLPYQAALEERRQRGLCDQHALAAVFGVSRGTIRNAIEDVQPLLDQDQYVVTPAERCFATAVDVLKFVAAGGETPC